MKERRIMTENEKDELVEMAMTGSYSRKEVADAFDVCVATVTNIIKSRKLEVPKWHPGGKISRNVSLNCDISRKEKIEEPRNEEEYIIVASQVLTIIGTETNFKYTIGTANKTIKIESGYCSDIEIDEKDIVNFSNELLSVAQKLENLRKNRFST